MIRAATTSRRFGRTTTRRMVAAAGVDPMEIARCAGYSRVAFTYDRKGNLFPEVDYGASIAIIASTFPLLNRMTGPEVARND
jgi:hypothetical protein